MITMLTHKLMSQPCFRLAPPLVAMLVAAIVAAPFASAQEQAPAPQPLTDTILPAVPGDEGISPGEVYRTLPRFGSELFRGMPAATPAERAEDAEAPLPASMPLPANYVIGPGDALSLQVYAAGWEQVAQEMSVTPEGFIFPDQLGRITAAGQTIEALRGALTERYSRIFTQPTVTLTISSQRTIEVYVTGEVRNPGRYLQHGMSTVLDALYAAGGPSEIGSYRDIRLTRIGAEPLQIDLYDYLLTGSREGDRLLEPGDTIFVPPAGPEVGLAGEVRRPARYEINALATVGDLLEMAGGLTPQAHEVLHLWRTDARQEWRMIAVAVTDASVEGMALPVEEGDLLFARGIRDTVGNTARILGAVKRPGYYPVDRYPTVSALIRAAEGLEVNAHVGRAVISRLNDDRHFEIVPFEVAAALRNDPQHDLPLQANDYVTVYEQDEVEPAFVVEVEGSVTRPGAYRWAENLRISQLLLRAGGLAPGAWTERADLLRLTPQRTYEVIPVNLAAALDGDPDEDVVLRRGDRLVVRDRTALGRTDEVHIAGFVNAEGSYPLRAGMRVSDLIFAAGGIAPGAGPQLQLTRGHYEGRPQPVSLVLTGEPRNFIVEPDMLLSDDDSVTVTGRGDFRQQAEVVFLRGRVEQPGAYPVVEGPGGEPYTVWDLVTEGGGLLDDASLGGMVVYRRRAAAMGDAQEDDLTRVLQSVNREAREQRTVQVSQEEQQEALQTSVNQQMRQVLATPSGVSIILPPHPVQEDDWVSAIPIDGHALIASAGQEENLTLEAGDTVMVPRRANTLMVLGAVPRSGAVPYVEGETTAYYVHRSGGYREDAAEDRMIVVHANGAVEPIKESTVLGPGDVVVVPTRHIVRTVRTESDLQTWLRAIVPIITAALIF